MIIKISIFNFCEDYHRNIQKKFGWERIETVGGKSFLKSSFSKNPMLTKTEQKLLELKKFKILTSPKNVKKKFGDMVDSYLSTKFASHCLPFSEIPHFMNCSFWISHQYKFRSTYRLPGYLCSLHPCYETCLSTNMYVSPSVYPCVASS